MRGGGGEEEVSVSFELLSTCVFFCDKTHLYQVKTNYHVPSIKPVYLSLAATFFYFWRQIMDAFVTA